MEIHRFACRLPQLIPVCVQDWSNEKEVNVHRLSSTAILHVCGAWEFFHAKDAKTRRRKRQAEVREIAKEGVRVNTATKGRRSFHAEARRARRKTEISLGKRSPLEQHRNSPHVWGLEIFSREDAKTRRRKRQAEVREIACETLPMGSPDLIREARPRGCASFEDRICSNLGISTPREGPLR